MMALHGVLEDWSMSQKAGAKEVVLRLYAGRTLDRAATVHSTAQHGVWGVGAGAVLHRPRPDRRHALRHEHASVHRVARTADRPGEPRSRRSAVRCSSAGCMRRRASTAACAPWPSSAGGGCRCTASSPASLTRAARTADKRVALAASSGSTASVTFAGFVSGDAKSPPYQTADVFVLSTSQEDVGCVSYEALSCGTSVIITRGTDTCKGARE